MPFSHNARVFLGTLAVAGAAVAIALWPQPALGYGWTFWLWCLSAVAYGLTFPPAETPRGGPDRLALATLFVILTIAACLRFPALTEHPGNIAIDEVYPGIEALHIAKGKVPNVFSSVGWFQIPRLCFAYPALFMKALGSNAFHELRLSSAVMGLGGIVFVYLLGRRLLNEPSALIAAFLMAVGFWHVHNSRTGFPFIQSSFAIPVVLYLVTRARQDRSLMGMAIAGLVLGLMLQGYFPVRALVLLVPLFLIGSWIAARESLRRAAMEGVILMAGAVITLGPLMRSVPMSVLTDRSRSILMFREAVFEWLAQRHKTNSVFWTLWENMQSAAGMFYDWADVCILNHSPAGLFDAITLAATTLGASIAVMRGKLRPLFLVMWAAIIFVFGVAMTDAPRASYRLAPAMPALYLLGGYGVYAALLSSPPRRRWMSIVVWPLLMMTFAGWIAVRNYHLFFVEYSGEGDGREFELAGVLRLVNEECDGRMLYWLSGEQARQADLFELFCPDFAAIDEVDIPARIDRGRDATFVVMRPWADSLARLEACYPHTRPVSHRAADNRFLFMRVDAKVEDVATPEADCAAKALSEREQKRRPPRATKPRRSPAAPPWQPRSKLGRPGQD